ncbi:MAG: hypothetical protein KTR24_02660 [Saprospiraceae bacterium]|nr:hypothetical protein [Saprospiraceae bacterium]
MYEITNTKSDRCTTSIRQWIVVLMVGLLGLPADAQFGIRAGYTQLPYMNSEADQTNQINALHVGLNYWYRLKDIRIEFFPEIRYQQPLGSDLSADLEDQSQLLGVALPVQFYPFDFISDCSCPTFSKQSRTFQKGFFLMASPGYFFDLSNHPAKSSAVELGVGAGFDIGINDLLTLSPLVQYSRLLRSEATPTLDRNWHFGLRASFRPDYRRRF